MTNPSDMHERIDTIRARLDNDNVHPKMHQALAAELHALIIATRLDQLTVAIYETNTPGTPAEIPASSTLPGIPDFDGEVEDLAHWLWKTDQRNTTGARSFADEYANIQDHYRDQAAYLLAPELMEENPGD